ncbi:hypothetical protein ACOMHN_027560 [Nucella lapillus]
MLHMCPLVPLDAVCAVSGCTCRAARCCSDLCNACQEPDCLAAAVAYCGSEDAVIERHWRDSEEPVTFLPFPWPLVLLLARIVFSRFHRGILAVYP